MDPDKSFSDFKIIIKQEETDTTPMKTTTYHVHKVIVCFGVCYSNYLRTLLSSGSFIENDTNSVTITLPELAANAFPIVLEYLYCDGHIYQPGITAETIVGIFVTADYLDIEQLRKEMKDFIEYNMNEKCHVFYADAISLKKDAISLNSDFIIREVEKHLTVEYLGSSNFDSHNFDSKILDMLTVEKMMKIIKKSEGYLFGERASFGRRFGLRSWQISTFVTVYIEKHQDELSAHDFYLLTNEEHMPIILYATHAFKLIELEEKVCKIEDKTAAELLPLKKRLYPLLDFETREWNYDKYNPLGWDIVAMQPPERYIDRKRRRSN